MRKKDRKRERKKVIKIERQRESLKGRRKEKKEAKTEKQARREDVSSIGSGITFISWFYLVRKRTDKIDLNIEAIITGRMGYPGILL